MLRRTLPDGYFHVIARARYGGELFVDGADRHRFILMLRTCEERHGWACHAYCLLTTHYHLVLEAKRAALSGGMHRLHGRYAMAFNRRHRRFGHVFAERFTARAIDDETYLFEACAYVVLNPVRAGVCREAREWRWSFSRYGLDTA
jgi:REP element-mobilizing transposase RayT